MNCEKELDLLWSKECIISELLNNTEAPTHPAANQPIAHLPEGPTTRATFEINNAKLNVPVVTLPINDNIKLSGNIKKNDLKENFFRIIIDVEQKHNKKTNLDYIIDPMSRNTNKFFLLSFRNGDNASYKKVF